VPDPLDPLEPLDLLGSWQLERTIDDTLAGDVSTVSGTLTLAERGPDEVAWHEEGEWRHRGRVLPVYRDLAVVRRAAGWWVLFSDGREFHPWSPGAEVVHPCGADTDRGLVEGTPEAWRVTWTVHGPAKDYTMVTELSPADV
jgi:hypothetical protein